jgi:hypothetical protein
VTVRMEVFSGEPPCAACQKVLALADDYAAKYHDELEVIKHIGQSAMTKFNEYGLWCTPAIVIDETIRIEGVCPSKETLDTALKEVGLQLTNTEL